MTKADITLVGVIISAHGIRGQVKIKTFFDITSCGTLTDAHRRKVWDITLHSMKNGIAIASIQGVTDRNEAELLKGSEFYADKDAIPASLTDELTGLNALLANGTPYGKITGIHNFGAGDIVDIEKIDGSTEMLPVKKPFVDTAQVKNGFVIIHPPEYIEGE